MDPNQTSQLQQPNNLESSSAISPRKSILVPVGVGAFFVIVAIGAYLLGTKQNQPVVQNSILPTPLPTEASAKVGIDETANWKTYTNIKYGYSLKYSPTWNVEEKDHIFKSKLVDGQMVSMTEIGNDVAKIQIFFEGEFDYGLTGRELEIEEKINLDGKVAIKEVFHEKGKLDSKWIVISIDNFNSFRIEFKGSASSLPIFDQILSTFKFTNP